MGDVRPLSNLNVKQPTQERRLIAVPKKGNRSRVEQDRRSGLAFEAGIDGIAEPLVDGTILEAAGF